MRYERLFPELHVRMQRSPNVVSLWKKKFWTQMASDFLLVLYTFPEVHLWGYGRIILRFIGGCCSKVPIEEPLDDIDIAALWSEAVKAMPTPETLSLSLKESSSRDLHRMSDTQSYSKRVAREVALAKDSHVSDRLAVLGRSKDVAGQVRSWSSALAVIAKRFPSLRYLKRSGSRQDSEKELQTALLMIALVYQLLAIKGGYEESRLMATVQRVDALPNRSKQELAGLVSVESLFLLRCFRADFS
jgi:hypothetical protein